MFSMRIRPEVLEKLRKDFKPGTRVVLEEMCDPYREMPQGMNGIVEHVDDAGGIHIKWDNGSTLAALHGVDRIRIASEE